MSKLIQPDFLSELKVAATGRAAYDELVIECVRKAREHGESWASIAQVLGVTRQAATQRYGKYVG